MHKIGAIIAAGMLISLEAAAGNPEDNEEEITVCRLMRCMEGRKLSKVGIVDLRCCD